MTPKLTVNYSTALESARAALTTPANGTWSVTESEVDADDGVEEVDEEEADDADVTEADADEDDADDD